MAISEVKMRKNELEDITNTSKTYHKKMTFKKVEKKGHAKSVSFENCLLTPKDEDYYDEHEHDHDHHHNDQHNEYLSHPSPNDSYSKENDMSHINSMPSPNHIDDQFEDDTESLQKTDTTSDSKSTEESKSDSDSKSEDSPDLAKNPDYIVLTSSLRLLKSNKNKISNEIVELSQLLSFFESCNDEGEIIKFFHKLVTNKLNLPKQNKILKCPIVKISNYQATESLKSTTNEKPLFKTLNLFNKQ